MPEVTVQRSVNTQVMYGITAQQQRGVKVKVLPIQATKALRAVKGIAVPNLRPRH